jgi:hypothetical protein
MADDIYNDSQFPEQGPNETPDEHARRVHDAFDTWHKSMGDKVSKEDEERVLGIRKAVADRDIDAAKQHIEKTKENSNWIVEELAKHPQISAIFRELAIFGF